MSLLNRSDTGFWSPVLGSTKQEGIRRMARGAPGVKRGARGVASKRLAELASIYGQEQAKSLKVFRAISTADLHAATGDPLALSDPDVARQIYDLDKASRPQKHLDRISQQTWGGSIYAALMMMDFFKASRDISDTMAAAETVALLARRGLFIGVRAPLRFEEAVNEVRKAWGGRHKRSAGPDGWTGQWLLVVPSEGGRLRDPEDMSILPSTGKWVRDVLFWRQRVAHGDVTILRREENPPTN